MKSLVRWQPYQELTSLHDAKFDVGARTESGELTVGRDDLDIPGIGIRHLIQKANGGGKRIDPSIAAPS